MRILVTGGAGFIGSHLTEALLKNGHKVSIVDDLSTGRMKNIKHLTGNKNLVFYKGTVLDEKLMKKLVFGSDFIYHLAAAVGVKYIIDNPLKSIQTNVKGTEIVLELASRHFSKKPGKILMTSTSEIYGKNEHIPFKEEDDRLLGSTTKSRWSYSCSKALDEFLALAYYREKRLPITIVRLFNTCGPRQVGDYGMVIPRFILQALCNKPITVYGNGRQTRSFLYVKDAVDAMISLSKNKKAEGEIFNIGSPERVTIEGLAHRIIAITNSKSKVKHVPYEKVYKNGFEDMHHRLPETSKARKFINFRPKYQLREILEKMAEDVKRDLK